MADRISARRSMANTFFLSIHTALVAAFTVFVKERLLPDNLIGFIPFLAVVVLCYVWWKVINSYKQLNSGKFAVIHEIEQLLPLTLYKAEWKALGEGKDKKKYHPLSHVENYVPICFALFYAFIGVSYYSSNLKNVFFSIINKIC